MNSNQLLRFNRKIARAAGEISGLTHMLAAIDNGNPDDMANLARAVSALREVNEELMIFAESFTEEILQEVGYVSEQR